MKVMQSGEGLERLGKVRALGAFIRRRRRELGLTQAELGEQVGYVQERISSLEHGKYGMPSIAALSALAEALQVDLLDLLCEAGYLQQAQRNGDGGVQAAHTVGYIRTGSGAVVAGLEELHRKLEDTLEGLEKLQAQRLAMERNYETVRGLLDTALKQVDPLP